MTTTTFFPADGGWRDFAKPVMRQIGVALVLPVVLYVVFGRFSTAVWMVAAIGSAVAVLLTQVRRSWGRGIAFQASSVQVSRRDGSTLEIVNTSISHVLLKTDCFGLVWQEGSKRRSLVVARESFSPATWERALEGARALQQSLPSTSAMTPVGYVVPATLAEGIDRPEVGGIGKADGGITVVDEK